MKLLSLFVSVPPINTLWKSTHLLPLWIPIKQKENIMSKTLYPITLADEKFTLYKNNNEELNCIFDVCPHQGARLSKGHISKEGNVVCPYHAFEFKDGNFNKMPMSKSFKSNICVPKLPIYSDSNFVYVLPGHDLFQMEGIDIPNPYIAPELSNSTFTPIIGERIINTNSELVTENVLDMLHISFVHSFGNRQMPLPFKISSEKISNITGITRFYYHAGQNSISRFMGDKDVIIVENEYHLPSTTVTRVIAGNIVKTVVTRAMPISENKTILFWELHRNFFHGKLGDIIMRFLMEKTLDEDVNILKNVDAKYRIGEIKTIYDSTILNYRQSKTEYSENI